MANMKLRLKRVRWHRDIPLCSNRNKWRRIRECLDVCRDVFAAVMAVQPLDWDNLQWPVGWDADKHYRLTRYCSDKLEKHMDGRFAEMCGGQKGKEEFNGLIRLLIKDDEQILC